MLVPMSSLAARLTIPREAVAVLYNTTMPESKELAEYYAKKRFIPLDNLVGLPLPKKGKISRKEYRDLLEKPLRDHFTQKKWWKLEKSSDGLKLSTSNKIKLLVCMYGVPFGVNHDKSILLPKDQKSNALTKYNCASVDGELSLLSVHDVPQYAIIQNKYFKKNQIFEDAELPYYMLVGRIDADSFSTCKKMIDDALAVEKTGLWGMTYLDLARKGAGYKIGDEWILQIEKKNWQLGIPTTIDRSRDTYLTNYPMRDVAMYFGWYTNRVNGPFLNPAFNLKRGAVAVHLHSFSASDLRNPKARWLGPLLKKGAAATVGNVYEPYLQFTHHFDILHDRLSRGYTFIESAYMAMPLLSWQNVAVGDPLYQPFLHLESGGEEAKEDLFYRNLRNSVIEFKDDLDALVRRLRSSAHKENDARYFEVAGLLNRFHGKALDAVLFFRSAHQMYLLDFDKTRTTLHSIDLFLEEGKKEQAVIACKALLEKIKKTPEAKTVQAKLNILSPPPPPPAQPRKKKPAKK